MVPPWARSFRSVVAVAAEAPSGPAARLVAIGLVVGVFSALFGVGGGIVAVPLLILAAGFPSRVATATSLGAIGITALAGSVLYAAQGGHVDVGYALLVGLPAAAGAVAGSTLQQRVAARALTFAFGALLVAIAIWLLVQAPVEADPAGVTSGASASHLLVAAALGFAAGILAGLFGIGGGLLFVPTLVWLGLGQLEAEGTSLLAILPTVLAGGWTQHRYGNLRGRAAATLGLSSVAGVEVGVLTAKALPEDALRTLFVVLMLGVAAQLVWRSRRRAPYASRT